GLTDEAMGLALGAFWLAYALFDVPAGWLGDRYGARLALTRVVLAWSLFTALTGSAVGLYSLLACRFLFGAGEAGAFPSLGRGAVGLAAARGARPGRRLAVAGRPVGWRVRPVLVRRRPPPGGHALRGPGDGRRPVAGRRLGLAGGVLGGRAGRSGVVPGVLP